jgi:gamma-butyrobetaine dioxygenase
MTIATRAAPEPAIAGVTPGKGLLTVDWPGGASDPFHYVWLRDNCPCARCRHTQTLERTYLFLDHATPSIRSARVHGNRCVEVEICPGVDDNIHVARFATGWLRAHVVEEAAARLRRHEPRKWDSTSLRRHLVHLGGRDYLDSDSGVRTWIEAVKVDGIVMLHDLRLDAGSLLEVARRIGPVRATNFGEVYDVVSMPKPNASAYTSLGLELHTDLPNWRAPPDVQLLFCLKSSVSGGESVFVDGFKVAEDLRLESPQAFAILSSQPVEFRFHDETCDIRHRSSVLELDREGRLMRVRFNNWLRTAADVSPEAVKNLYAALGEFWSRLRDSRYRFEARLEPGDLVAFDNNRVLHGRAPFDASGGERHLRGCYLNQEDVDSRLRMLERKAV